MTQQSHPLVVTQRNWKLCSHKSLRMDTYSSFIHICQNLEATKVSFSRRTDKLWYIRWWNIILCLKKKKKELSSHEKTGGNLLLSEGSQSEKATYNVPQYLRELVPWRPLDTKIHRCSSPLYKIKQ